MHDGDPPARGHGLEWIRSVMGRFEAPLLKLATGICGDPEAAREVVQDAFVRLCDQAPDSVRETPVLARWLYTTTRRRALDVQRGEQRMRNHVRPDAEAVDRAADDQAEPMVRLERRESLKGLARYLIELPARQREALEMKFGDGLSYREIAAVTGQSVGTVGFHLHVGLKTLRGKFQRAERRATT